jgi:hypothetical protein
MEELTIMNIIMKIYFALVPYKIYTNEIRQVHGLIKVILRIG